AGLGGIADRRHHIRGDGGRARRTGAPAHGRFSGGRHGGHAGGSRRRGAGDHGDGQVIRHRVAADRGGHDVRGRGRRGGGLPGDGTGGGVKRQAGRQGGRHAPSRSGAAGHSGVGRDVLVHDVRGILGDVG